MSAAPLPSPLEQFDRAQTITIYRASNCWMARVPEWEVGDIPLPFSERAAAHQVEAHLKRLQPGARIVREEIVGEEVGE